MAGLSEAIRDARPRVIAALAAHFRDIDLAQDAFADACATMLESRIHPENVGAWLFVSARRKALDMIRRTAAEQRALARESDPEVIRETAQVIQLPQAIPDERLRLLFVCCHPALALDARLSLALRTILGVPVGEIACLFALQEGAIYQRITRAKKKIRLSGIPFEVPERRHWGERLEAVLDTVELAYTLAYSDAAGDHAELGEEALRLALLVAELIPHESEALGLAALMLLGQSRSKARLSDDGAMIPLSQQDTALWDISKIEQARQCMDQARSFGSSGPRQILATIHLVHCARVYGMEVDRAAIVKCYEALVRIRPGPITDMNFALALTEAGKIERADQIVASLDSEKLEASLVFHVAIARIAELKQDFRNAISSLNRALSLHPQRAEQQYLENWLCRMKQKDAR